MFRFQANGGSWLLSGNGNSPKTCALVLIMSNKKLTTLIWKAKEKEGRRGGGEEGRRGGEEGRGRRGEERNNTGRMECELKLAMASILSIREVVMFMTRENKYKGPSTCLE
jgi:hypothetical protein